MRHALAVTTAAACCLFSCASCDDTTLSDVTCGDGVCEAAGGENCDSCAKDCTCAAGLECTNQACTKVCGNGTCSASAGENCLTCPDDCGCATGTECTGAGKCTSVCGNGRCEADREENCGTCASDCACGSLFECAEGACRLACGNGTCDTARGEGCTTCKDDCACQGATQRCATNACVDLCGNSTCEPEIGETCTNCASDCSCTGATTCNATSGACESAAVCDPNVDCALTFPLTADLRVNVAGAGDTAHATVGTDPDGRVFVGYAQKGTPNSFTIRRLSGGSFVPAGAHPTEGYFQGSRVIVALAPNKLLAFWEYNPPAPSSESTHVRVSRSTDAGGTWSTPVKIDKVGVNDNSGDISAVAVNGIVYALFRGYVTGCSASSCYEVFFVKSSDEGATWTAPKRLSNDRDQDDHVAIAAAGSLVVAAWNTFDGDLRVARSTDGGTTFSTPVTVNDVPEKARNYRNQFIALRGQRVHVVWSDSRTDSEGDIRMDTSNDGGATWGTDREVHSVKNRWQTDPAVRIAPDGRAWVIWADSRNNNSDIYAAGTKDGECFCKSVRVSREPANAACSDEAQCTAGAGRCQNGNCTYTQENPSLAIDADGALHVGWRATDTDDIGYNAAKPQ